MIIPIDSILPNPDQPRTIFNQNELEELSQSIHENGLIQPVVVEQAGNAYILIDGERRWRACKLAGLEQIEAVIRPSSNHNGIERLTKALVANVQRSDMGPVDEARAYQRLIDKYGTAEMVAEKVGVSEGTVSMRLALLEFPEAVQKLYNLKRLPLHGTVLAALKRLKPEQQIRICTMAATRGWTSSSMIRLMAKERKGIPAYVTQKRGPKQHVKISGKFDALSLVNKNLSLPIKEATLTTCKACSLYEEASPVICKECPLPEFLRRLQGGRGDGK